MDYKVIGIDPSSRKKCGICRWNPYEQAFIDFRSATFWQTIRFIAAHDAEKTLVICENPIANKPVFGWQQILAKEGPQVLAKRSQDIGMNKAAGLFINQFLAERGYAHIAKRPGKKPWKGKGKITQPQFEQLTGCTWKLNQDERDAGLLVYGLPALVAIAHIQNR